MIRSFGGKTPKIAESAFVSETAYVIGDVEIGEGSGIWPGAVVRGDFASIKIGRNTMIEDNSVVHTGEPMEIGDNVTIGHGVVVHGIKIGNNTLVGNNATVLDNAEIGSFCVIGAGCLVRQGMVIPYRNNGACHGDKALCPMRNCSSAIKSRDSDVPRPSSSTPRM